MSKRLGRLLSPICHFFSPFISVHRWLGLPTGVSSAYCHPSCLVEPSLGYFYPSPRGCCLPPELDLTPFYSLEGRVWVLADATATARASHYNRDGELLWELSEQFHYSRPIEHPDFAFKWHRIGKKTTRERSSTVSLIIDGPCNLYHWLYDALPRLFLVEKAGLPIRVIYGNFSRSFTKESLEMLGYGDCKLIEASKVEAVTADSLIIPSFILYGGCQIKPVVPKWALEWLREKFLDKTSLTLDKPKRRLFISREDATYRFLVDEERLFDSLLRPRGFERVLLGKRSLSEQIELFATCEVVVAPHGAGLANLLFCPKKTTVLELFHPGFIQRCYWQIASALGFNYYALVGEGSSLPDAASPFANIQVMPLALETTLIEMGL